MKKVKTTIRGKSPQELRAEAAKLAKTLPKLQGKALRQTKKLIAHLHYHADFKESGGLTRKQQKQLAARTTAIAQQGLLPGFSKQVRATAAEMARELVWEALQKQLNVEMAEIKRKLKLA